MRLVDYLDKGASLGPDRPCLTTDGVSLTYRDVQDLSHRIAAALVAVGVGPATRSRSCRPTTRSRSAACSGISRAGAVWCQINPRSESTENRDLLDLFDCPVLVYQA